MAIRTVVTAGFGNGTFNGTIPLVITRGYAIGAVTLIFSPGSSVVYVLFKDKRSYVKFKDKRSYVKFKDKRSITRE